MRPLAKRHSCIENETLQGCTRSETRRRSLRIGRDLPELALNLSSNTARHPTAPDVYRLGHTVSALERGVPANQPGLLLEELPDSGQGA